MLRTILKSMTVDGIEVEAGSVVDVSGWRNVAVLERSRYLGPATEVVTESKPKSNKARVSEPTEL